MWYSYGAYIKQLRYRTFCVYAKQIDGKDPNAFAELLYLYSLPKSQKLNALKQPPAPSLTFLRKSTCVLITIFLSVLLSLFLSFFLSFFPSLFPPSFLSFFPSLLQPHQPTQLTLPPNRPHTRNHNRVLMSPKPNEFPLPPPIRRLLLHTLQPSRHRHLPLPVLLPARQLLPLLIQHNQRR